MASAMTMNVFRIAFTRARRSTVHTRQYCTRREASHQHTLSRLRVRRPGRASLWTSDIVLIAVHCSTLLCCGITGQRIESSSALLACAPVNKYRTPCAGREGITETTGTEAGQHFVGSYDSMHVYCLRKPLGILTQSLGAAQSRPCLVQCEHGW